ncbi:MAG TPA: AAA family ATPase [Vicinamibacterales bacterium]|nr:AAA family ATPase [Vicinamibacterales bacterium]
MSTDAKFFYASAAHERASLALLTAIGSRAGITLLTGDPGSGKTMLCRMFTRRLDRHTLSSFVPDAVASLDGLLTTMLVDLGVMTRDDSGAAGSISRENLIRTLQVFVDSLTPLHAAAVIVVDQAESQPADVLEELVRVAGPIQETGALHIVLVGVPSFAETLWKRAQLQALHAAIARRVDLGPLTRDELDAYVGHRLAVAGSKPLVRFDDGALDRIFALSGGLPGQVNQLCDRALGAGFERLSGTIEASMIEASISDGGGAPANAESPAAPRRGINVLVAVLFIAFAAAAIGAAFWVLSDQRAQTSPETVPPPPAAPALSKPRPLRAIPPADAPANNPR